FNKMYAKIYAIKGNNKKAFQFMMKAFKDKTKELSNVTTDYNQLLYAHAQAEISQKELNTANAIKQKRLYWIIGISITGLLLILLIYLIYIQHKIKTKRI